MLYRFAAFALVALGIAHFGACEDVAPSPVERLDAAIESLGQVRTAIGDPAPAPPLVQVKEWYAIDERGVRIGHPLESVAGSLKPGTTIRLVGVPPVGAKGQSLTVTVAGDVLPPEPKPDVPVVPILSEEFTVLILEDRESNRSLPKPQLDALQSVAILEYLDRKCAKVGGFPEWRKWDDNLTPERIAEDEPWKARYLQAYKDSNGVRPWLYATNGRAAISIKFPADEASLMAELKKLGGD